MFVQLPGSRMNEDNSSTSTGEDVRAVRGGVKGRLTLTFFIEREKGKDGDTRTFLIRSDGIKRKTDGRNSFTGK